MAIPGHTEGTHGDEGVTGLGGGGCHGPFQPKTSIKTTKDWVGPKVNQAHSTKCFLKLSLLYNILGEV